MSGISLSRLTQERKAWRKEHLFTQGVMACEECVCQVPALRAPHFSEGITLGHYTTISHYLRANLFPGCCLRCSSVVKEAYVPHLPLVRDPERWHGHRTDHLVKWTEQNILEQRLHKLLKELK